MSNNYSSYANGLKIGDLIHYEFKNVFWRYSSSKSPDHGEHGIVLDREYMFTSTTTWGPRKFFVYNIISLNGNVHKLKTQYIKILKRTGAL